MNFELFDLLEDDGISLDYDEAFDFHGGLAIVKKNNKYGYINKLGKEVIPCQYDEVFDFNEDLAVVRKNNKYGYINKLGRVVIHYQFDEAYKFSNGLAIVAKNKDIYIIDKFGKPNKFRTSSKFIEREIKKIRHITKELEFPVAYNLLTEEINDVKEINKKLFIKKETGENIMLDLSEIEQIKRLIKI